MEFVFEGVDFFGHLCDFFEPDDKLLCFGSELSDVIFEFGDFFKIGGIFVLEGLEFEGGGVLALRDFEDLVLEGLDELIVVEDGMFFVFEFFVEVFDFGLVFDSEVFKLFNDIGFEFDL